MAYLLPHSPHLNPIEEAFSAAKSFLKANEEIVSTSRVIEDVLLTAFDNVTPLDCIGWYQNSIMYMYDFVVLFESFESLKDSVFLSLKLFQSLIL